MATVVSACPCSVHKVPVVGVQVGRIGPRRVSPRGIDVHGVQSFQYPQEVLVHEPAPVAW